MNSFASYHHHHDIVFGNIIGSNNFNLFIILGLAGLISPLVVQSSTVWKEIPLSLAAVIILFVMTNDFFAGHDNLLSRLDGGILLVFFALFLYYVYKQLRVDKSAEEKHKTNLTIIKISVYIILGLAGLVIGGRMIVNSSITIATILGVSEKIIGLTIVAAGTSLPELATSVVAAIKKNNDIAVGNIIGSNIFNIFFILGISSLIQPVRYNLEFNKDMFILAAGTIILFIAMFTGKKKKLDRWEAFLLFLIYSGYTYYLIQLEI